MTVFHRLLALFVLLLTALAPVPAAAQDPEPLPAPVQLSPADRSYMGTEPFMLIWTPIEGATSYEIEVSSETPGGASFRYTSNDNQHTLYDLPPNDSFFWVVRAIHPNDSRLNSGWSPYPLWAFTTSDEPFLPITPQTLWASEGVFHTYVELNIHFSVRATHYIVTRTDQTNQQETLFTVTYPHQFAGLYNDTSVVIGRRYLYTVQACNSAGCSPNLSPAREGWAGECLPEPPGPPILNAPRPNSTFFYEPDTLDYYLRWEEMPGIVEYQTQVYDQVTGALVIDEINGGSQEMHQEGLFRWRVRALDPVQGCLPGAWSSFWNYQARLGPPPATPLNVRASQGTHPGVVELTWDTPAAETMPDEHQIYWSETPLLVEEQSFNSNYGGSSYTVEENLEPGRVYYFWVKACQHTRGCSAPSQRVAGWPATSSADVLRQIVSFPRIGR